jgi:hypothetical protein
MTHTKKQSVVDSAWDAWEKGIQKHETIESFREQGWKTVSEVSEITGFSKSVIKEKDWIQRNGLESQTTKVIVNGTVRLIRFFRPIQVAEPTHKR